MRSRTISLSIIAALALTTAACGGDDSSSPLDQPAEVATDAPPSEDTGDTGDAGDADADDAPSPALPGAEIPAEAREMLEEMGIDPDNLDGFDLEGFMEDMDEWASSFGGDGGGTVTVGDVTYTVDADMCLSFGPDLTVDGPATGSDGSVAWVSADHNITLRDDLEGFMDESQIDMLFGDRDEMTNVDVTVRVGATSRMQDGDPEWMAYGGDAFGTDIDEFTFSGGRLTGSGTATSWGEEFLEAPITFDVACD